MELDQAHYLRRLYSPSLGWTRARVEKLRWSLSRLAPFRHRYLNWRGFGRNLTPMPQPGREATASQGRPSSLLGFPMIQGYGRDMNACSMFLPNYSQAEVDPIRFGDHSNTQALNPGPRIPTNDESQRHQDNLGAGSSRAATTGLKLTEGGFQRLGPGDHWIPGPWLLFSSLFCGVEPTLESGGLGSRILTGPDAVSPIPLHLLARDLCEGTSGCRIPQRRRQEAILAQEL